MGHVYRRLGHGCPVKTQTEKDARSVEAPRSSGAEVADFLARVTERNYPGEVFWPCAPHLSLPFYSSFLP